jgi:hypothetical protein
MKLPEDIPDATLHKETKLTLHPSPCGPEIGDIVTWEAKLGRS